MTYINGINEVANPLLIVVPIILISISGYAIGRIMSVLRRMDSIFLRDFTYGNIVINFLFILGFIIFGVITYSAKVYFTVFTYILIVLTAVGVYFLLKSWTTKHSRIYESIYESKNLLLIFGVALFVTIIVYQGIIIYYHPIFSEYDAIYDYLLTSKSILLGNGLNHDFYRGSDVAIRTPPISNAFNAWLIDSFGYAALRIFPVYFVIITSLIVFHFARNITKDSFMGIIASTAFLITPSILVMSSRFSLYNDLIFALFLSSTFFFLFEIVSQPKITKIHLFMLIVSLSLATLSKELGLVIAGMILLLLPAMKFSQDNLKLKIIFSILSFLPLYALTFYDLNQNGITFVIGIRLATVLLTNLAVFYLVLQVRNQEKFATLFRNSMYLIPLALPIVFVVLNLVIIHGPYPVLSLSASAQQSLNSYRDLYGIQNNLFLNLSDALQKIPRVDVLFIALAAGPIFIFFKLRGFVMLIGKLKSNSQYVAILVSVILLLLIWSYFDLGFQTSQIRHLAYFAPLLSVIIAMGMSRKGVPYKLYYYGVIAYSFFYFLSNSVQAWFYSNKFAGFWIEPYNDPILGLSDIVILVAFMSPLIILELRENKIRQLFMKDELRKVQTFVVIPLVLMLGFQLYALYSSQISFGSLEEINKTPPGGWENNVFDVVNYLNQTENGNILSVRAPAISFFTNRTNFDLYSPHTFATIFPLLQIENSTLFKQKISEMNIRYFVIPNENSQLYSAVQNLAKDSKLLQTLADDDFVHISLKSFDIYKFDKSGGVNLLNNSYSWIPVNDAKISTNNSALNIAVQTNNTNIIYNRGILQTQINFSKPPVLLLLNYASQSHNGQATFYTEISDVVSDKFLWGSLLDNTEGKFETKTFLLPDTILNKQVKIKLYIITIGPGDHMLIVKKLRVTHT